MVAAQASRGRQISKFEVYKLSSGQSGLQKQNTHTQSLCTLHIFVSMGSMVKYLGIDDCDVLELLQITEKAVGSWGAQVHYSI